MKPTKPAKVLQSTGGGLVGSSISSIINSDDIVEGKTNRFWHGEIGEYIDRVTADGLYVHNCLSAYQGDGSGLYVYQGIFSNNINILQTSTQSYTGLYNYNGNLYWDGTPLIQNSFVNIKDSNGNTKISASNQNDSLRFLASGNLTVSFDSANNSITYSAGPESSTYYYEFSMPESVYNCQKYFYSGSKQPASDNGLHSGSAGGFGSPDAASPIMSPVSGIITKAILRLGGSGVLSSSVAYPAYFVCNMIKQTYDGVGTDSYLVTFSIDSSHQVGTFGIARSDVVLESASLSISVDKGDMLSLASSTDSGTYGAASTVLLFGEAFVTLSIDVGAVQEPSL